MNKNIYAGIVLYNPCIERLKLNIESVINQVEFLILVDNNSSNLSEIEKLINGYSKIRLIKNESNLGIACALNQIFKYARNDGALWVLTLDQDSICSDNMVNEMYKYSNDDVGIVCPAINYKGLGSHINSEDVSYPYACMTSGSLTSVEAWKKVKGFEESYFIDFVDNEFCMKLKINNYKIIRVNSCVLDHELGEDKEFNFLYLKKIKYSEHSPLRLYYMVRNNFVFIKTYKKELFVLKEYLKIYYIIFKNLFLGSHFKSKFKYIIYGFKDSRKKNMGVCPYKF